MINSLEIRNFRRLEYFSLPDLGPVSVFFGPNGAGKSSVLDALWFVRDCFVRNVEEALVWRGGGSGLSRQGAGVSGPRINVKVHERQYEISFRSTLTNLVDKPEERLVDTSAPALGELVSRGILDDVFQRRLPEGGVERAKMRDSRLLALRAYLELATFDQSSQMVGTLLDRLGYYRIHEFNYRGLRFGISPSSPGSVLFDTGDNLWSVLRNLHDRRALNPTYDIILKWLNRAFPEIRELVFTQAGNNQVFAQFVMAGLREPVSPNNAASGYVQMLLLLTALYSAGVMPQVILLDEPETSLHPWAIFVLAEAIQDATKKWGRQVIVATHSPVLLSQFPEESLYLMMPNDGATTVQRVSEMTENRDLLDQYAVGALYMSQMIGEQSPEPMAHVTTMSDQ